MSQVKFVVLCACVAAASFTLAVRAQAAPITVQSYSYNNLYHVPSGSYPDTGTTELIDGLYPPIGSGTAYTDSRWVGVSDGSNDGLPQPEIIFNLGASYDVNSFNVIYDVDHGPVIYAPDSVSVSFSTDNVLYSTPVSLTGFDDSGSAQITRSTTFNLPSGSIGQYAKLSFYNDEQWTFLAEISFDGEVPVVPPVPEPSSLLLLGLGMLGMVKVARRRK